MTSTVVRNSFCVSRLRFPSTPDSMYIHEIHDIFLHLLL